MLTTLQAGLMPRSSAQHKLDAMVWFVFLFLKREKEEGKKSDSLKLDR